MKSSSCVGLFAAGQFWGKAGYTAPHKRILEKQQKREHHKKQRNWDRAHVRAQTFLPEMIDAENE